MLTARRVGRKVDLRWLINEQKARDGAIVFDQISMQTYKCGEVISQPVRGTADFSQLVASACRVYNHRQTPDVKPDGGGSVFQFKLRRHVSDTIRDPRESSVKSLTDPLWIKLGTQFGYFPIQFLNTIVQKRRFRFASNRAQKE